jgi:hypothetical protein
MRRKHPQPDSLDMTRNTNPQEDASPDNRLPAENSEIGIVGEERVKSASDVNGEPELHPRLEKNRRQ